MAASHPLTARPFPSPAAPATDRRQAFVHSGRNSLRCQAVARQQHDPRPPNHLLRRISVPNQSFLSFAISRADFNLLDLSHRRRLAGLRRFVNRLSATEHLDDMRAIGYLESAFQSSVARFPLLVADRRSGCWAAIESPSAT